MAFSTFSDAFFPYLAIPVLLCNGHDYVSVNDAPLSGICLASMARDAAY
jgi:hypothetical protein